MTEKHYVGIDRLLTKNDQTFISEAISEAIQEKLCQEDELVGALDYQIHVTYQTEIDNSSSDLEKEDE
tara:strand:+ start:102 stop:305 length:204 start_codon:yes stop_codon:yes gene_type:complete